MKYKKYFEEEINKEFDIYEDETREYLMDDDEISDEEEAFMEGYAHA